MSCWLFGMRCPALGPAGSWVYPGLSVEMVTCPGDIRGEAFCRDCFKVFHVHKFGATTGRNSQSFRREVSSDVIWGLWSSPHHSRSLRARVENLTEMCAL